MRQSKKHTTYDRNNIWPPTIARGGVKSHVGARPHGQAWYQTSLGWTLSAHKSIDTEENISET
jgi:hypothetical protein